jgi:hypothetical protein
MLKESFLSARPIPSLGLLVFFFIIENDHEVSCLQDKIYLDALLGSCCFWVQALSSYVSIATNVLLCTSRLHNRTCWSSCYQQSCCTWQLTTIIYEALLRFCSLPLNPAHWCSGDQWSPKRVVEKKRKKAIYTVPSHQWAVPMQSILCRVNPQGGSIPRIRDQGQGNNATLGWVARCLFIEFWNNSQILMCWTHWIWAPIIILNTRVVAKKGSCSTRSAYDQLLHIWKATLIAKGKCCYYSFLGAWGPRDQWWSYKLPIGSGA